MRFVYIVERGTDGEIERYRARLMAKEFTQCPGMDFFKISSPVTVYNLLVRTGRDISAIRWNLRELDFKQV